MAVQIYSDYYIDESGNTGDLSAVRLESYFTEQRMFGLAAFGCSLDETFLRAFATLKAEHRLQGAEVKSKHVCNRPRFMADLLDLLDAHAAPLFIELVDKHYFCVTNIIGHMVMPYVGDCDIDPRALWVKSKMADHMALYAPPALVQRFAACCQSRDHVEIRDLFKAIIHWAEDCAVPPREIASSIAEMARVSLKEYRKLPKRKAVARALPIPDANPAGKLLWVLPNLSSFTHIYARINRFARRKVAGVTLFHDEQLQFGDILLRNKVLAEELAALGKKLPMTTSDFEFLEAADLQFIRSHECVGIQIADVLAGFLTRFVQDAIWGGNPVMADRKAIFDRLVKAGDRNLGTGVNFVAPDSLLRALEIEPLHNF